MMTDTEADSGLSRETRSVAASRVLLVTGMSGSGKTTVLKALEDAGFEVVDNLPLSLLETMMRLPDRLDRPLAVGIDIRTRDFGVESVLAEIGALDAEGDISASLIFVDCEDEVIARRFAETRRRHPLGEDRPPLDGIRQERRLILGLRDRADLVIDTSLLTPHELRRFVQGQFPSDASGQMTVFVTSFSYRHGLPREADLVFDVRFLRNPHYQPELRLLTGKDAAVGDYIRRDSGYQPFVTTLRTLLDLLIPRYRAEGKSYLTIGFGCTGGHHRSVYLAREVGDWLANHDIRVSVVHRDVDR